jgi:hypothetical protein
MTVRFGFCLGVFLFLSCRWSSGQNPAPTSPSQLQTSASEANSQTGSVAYVPDKSVGGETELTAACQATARYTPAYSYCTFFAGYLVNGTTNDDGKSRLRRLVHIETNPQSLADAYLIYKTASAFNVAAQNGLQGAANNPQKKQVSSPAVSSGSTSLVSKSVATNLVGIAVESGALTQTQSGNTITLQTDPDHLFREAFTGASELSYLPTGTPYLENLTVSASLAANTNSTISVPASGSATASSINAQSVLSNSSVTKLSSITANYEFNDKLTQGYLAKFLKKHDLTHIVIQPDSSTAPALAKARYALQSDIQTQSVTPPQGCGDSDIDQEARDFLASLKSIKPADSAKPNPQLFDEFVTAFNSCFDQEVSTAIKGGKDVDNDTSAYFQALQGDITSFQSSLKEQLSGWDVTAQYVFNKPVGQPETHDFRVIGSGDLSKSAGSSWTVNAAWSIYGSVPSGAQYGRLKDAQFSGELDKSLGSSSSAPSFSLAGYGQYQSKPSVLNITSSSVPSTITLPSNAQVFLSGTQGWLGVVQAKFTVNIAGAQIPIAGKWSNKTDLLDKSKVGAQFGICYDFSQLKQLVGLGAGN